MVDDPKFAVTISLPIVDVGRPSWDGLQSWVDNGARLATDAGDEASVSIWNALHDAISGQLP